MFWIIAVAGVVVVLAAAWWFGRRRTTTAAELERQRIARGIHQGKGEQFRGSGGDYGGPSGF